MPKPPAGKKYTKKYTEQDITQAVAAIKNGMPKKEAARLFQIPRATLQFRVNNEIINPKPGPPTVLTETEEKTLEEWIITSSKKGFPRRKEDVLYSVEQFLKKNPRPNVFINNKPGEGWYKLFLKRHPNISSRTAEAVTSASANVSEQNIRQWFSQIKNTLEEEQLFEVLGDPSRVFNGDETGFQLCPKQGKVLAQRGARDVYEVDMAPAKSSITVMFTFSASGTITPPLVIYPLKRMRAEIQASVPSHWGLSLSETGWMTMEIFYQYITNVLHPYLLKQNVVFPIILFLDGHKSHINYELSLKCKELGIVLIALYPNATRILQPADVAAFKPIKNGWKKAILEWRRNNIAKQLTKVDFGRVLSIVLEKHINSEVIQNGFRACGLHPWNPDAINFSKCLGAKKPQIELDVLQTQAKILTLSDFQRLVGADIILRLESEIPEQRNCFHGALDNIYKFLKNDNPDVKSNDKPQAINQENLCIDGTWFPIDEIHIVLNQNPEEDENLLTQTLDDNVISETSNKSTGLEKKDIDAPAPEQIIPEEIYNKNLNENFELIETYNIEEQKEFNENKIVLEPENIKDNKIQKTDYNFNLWPIYNENYSNETDNCGVDNSEINITLSDDVENLQINLLKQLQNDEFQNPTNIQNETKQSEQIVEKLDTSKATDENSISIESVVCHDKLRTPLKLKDCLDWPSTPVRKGRKISAKPLYVLTAAKWLDNEEMKIKEKEKLITEKEQRKELREKAKQAKKAQKENKKLTQNEIKIKNTKKEDVIAENCKDTMKENKLKRHQISEIRKINIFNKRKKTDSEVLLESENAKMKETKNITEITETEKFKEIDMKKNVRKTDIVIKNKEKDEIKSKDIGKTNLNIIRNSEEKYIVSAKKIKILSIAPVPTQFNVKRKLFDDSDSKGSSTTAKTAENINANIKNTAVITKTDDLRSKEKTNKIISNLKKVNITSRLPLPAKVSSINVERHSVDEKPIFSETKKILERRATFRNNIELQDFINEHSD